MNFLWEKFNIKTFPADTAVFIDGVFNEEISDTQDRIEIKKDGFFIKKADPGLRRGDEFLPFHLIFVGDITKQNKAVIPAQAGIHCCAAKSNNQLNNACGAIDPRLRGDDAVCEFVPGLKKIRIVNETEGELFITVKSEIKNPTVLQFFIENAGEFSKISGQFTFLNDSDLDLTFFGDHLVKNTAVLIKNKILADTGSSTKVSGVARILGGCESCDSDMDFSAMCAPDIKSIEFNPTQELFSPPSRAEHSASIYRGTKPQIEYLSSAGISREEIGQILRNAFLES